LIYLRRDGLIFIISNIFLGLHGVECPELDKEWVESLLPPPHPPGREESLPPGYI